MKMVSFNHYSLFTIIHIVPGIPDNVSLTTINSTSLQLSWLPPLEPNGIIIGYYISVELQPVYQNYLTGSLITIATYPDEDELILNDLHSFAGYTVTIQATTRVGNGTIAIVTGVTFESCKSNIWCTIIYLLILAPSVGVSNLTATSINSTSVNISWTPPPPSNWNGILINYTVMYMTNDDNINPSLFNVTYLLPKYFNNDNSPTNINSELSILM